MMDNEICCGINGIPTVPCLHSPTGLVRDRTRTDGSTTVVRNDAVERARREAEERINGIQVEVVPVRTDAEQDDMRREIARQRENERIAKEIQWRRLQEQEEAHRERVADGNRARLEAERRINGR